MSQDTQGFWKRRHKNAMISPRTLHEKGMVQIIRGLKDYAAATNEMGYKMSEDSVLGDAWFKIISGLHGLLDGNLDRLDGGSLDSLMAKMLIEEDYATTWHDESTDSYNIDGVDNYGIRHTVTS